MSIGKRITELRKKAGLTQLQLAERLNITDKAVSKWESDGGDPSIQSLKDLANVFDVSLDYILTGIDKTTVITMSNIQKIAYQDDVETLKRYPYPLDYGDDYGKNITDYIYEYKSYRIFKYLLHSQHLRLLMNNIQKSKNIDDFLIFCVMANELGVISNNVKQPYFPLYLVDIEEIDKKKNLMFSSMRVSQDFINFILSDSNISNDVWKLIMGDGTDVYWAKGLSYILEKAIKIKHPKVMEIISFVEEKNGLINEKINSRRDYNNQPEYYILNGFLVNKNNPRVIIGSYFNVTKQTVINALNHSDYELVDRLNNISGILLSEYEIKMDKVLKNKNMNPKDKLRESVIVNGLLDIDKLIALDDFDLYQEMIKLPTTKLEEAQQLYSNSDLKEFFKYAVNNNLTNVIETIKRNQLDRIERALLIDFGKLKSTVQFRHLDKHAKNPISMTKNIVRFSQIYNHKDIRFFEYASKCDLKNRDNALEKIVKDRPNEHKIIKVLLDNGARLHHRWIELPGDEYESYHDDIDDVATELLRNQINIFLDKEES